MNTRPHLFATIFYQRHSSVERITVTERSRSSFFLPDNVRHTSYARRLSFSPPFSKRRWNEFPLIAGLLAARELRERMETNYFSQAGTDDRSLSCVGIDFINTANRLPVWLPRRETTGRLIKPGDDHFNLSTFIRSLCIPGERHRDVSQTKHETPLATVTSVRLFELHTRVQV